MWTGKVVNGSHVSEAHDLDDHAAVDFFDAALLAARAAGYSVVTTHADEDRKVVQLALIYRIGRKERTLSTTISIKRVSWPTGAPAMTATARAARPSATQEEMT